jgi:hypothetical protein
MATIDLQTGPDRVRRLPGYPLATMRFDLLATVLAAWVVIGVFVDVNAHNHGQVDDTFFTPWHFLLYSGVLANGLFLLIAQYRYVGQGYAWLKALPAGYFLSLIGVLVFAFGGVFDFFWHAAFGFEANLEALLSPAHLLLATGGVLFMAGPLRALWGRAQAQAGWVTLFPALVSALMVMSILTLFTQYANLITQPDFYVRRLNFANEVAAIAGILIPAVILTSTLLLLIRRWTLPLGAVTFFLLINGLLMFGLRISYIERYWPVLAAPLLAGLVGDVILRWRGHVRLLALAVPFTYMLVFFLILLASGSLWWSIHMWLGVTFMAGITGYGLSFLTYPPAIPDR